MADIGAMYVPILPDTTQLTSQIDQIGAQIRVVVRDAVLNGIKDALKGL